MIQRMFQASFLVCLLLAIGGFITVGCGSNKPGGDAPIEPTPDEILRFGDKLPYFSLEDIHYMESSVNQIAKEAEIFNQKVPPHIVFKGRIDLRDGTRYICTGPDECIIGLPDWTITQGTIEVYKKEADHDFPKN